MKKAGFLLIIFFASALCGFIVLEAGLGILDRAPVQSTWLAFHERGASTNLPNLSPLHTHRDIRVRYELSELRTRGTAPDPEHFNIWMFGDSFTFGLLLQEEETFVHHLNTFAESESCLARANIRFINAGVGGTGLSNWPAWLEVFGDDLPVDALFFMHNYDDMERSFWSNHYVLQGGQLLPSLRWIERPLKQRLDRSGSWRWLRENFRSFTMIHTLMWRSLFFEDIVNSGNPAFMPPPFFEQMEEWVDYNIRLSRALYLRSLELADQSGVPLWAGSTGWLAYPHLSAGNEAVFAALPQLLEELDVPWFDISPALYETLGGDYEPATIPGDTHPNPDGARLIAELLWAELAPFLKTVFECE
ncbi:MAG: hypothetical protein JJU35_00010 [Balneolales bacterium]|nr:hypothetical protein [Balneolales bacterium]